MAKTIIDQTLTPSQQVDTYNLLYWHSAHGQPSRYVVEKTYPLHVLPAIAFQGGYCVPISYIFTTFPVN